MDSFQSEMDQQQDIIEDAIMRGMFTFGFMVKSILNENLALCHKIINLRQLCIKSYKYQLFLIITTTHHGTTITVPL